MKSDIDHPVLLPEIQAMDGKDEIITAWKRAAFSTLPDHSLQRYFRYQLEAVLANKPRDCEAASDQLALIRELLRYLAPEAADELIAPDGYRVWLLAELPFSPVDLQSRLCDQLDSGALQGFVNEIIQPENNASFCFRTLHYFDLLIRELNGLLPEDVPDKLLQLNFNSLIYWTDLVSGYRKQLGLIIQAENRQLFLSAELNRIAAMPERLHGVYHPEWPSLKTMLSGWLKEQLANEASAPPVVHEKLTLNISVAQLACWLRLTYEEGLFKETSLKALFQFFAGHFESKKQQSISAGSLSKEYYSSGQVPAAMTKDRLLKMIARLNRHFFPVWFVTGVLSLFH